MVLSVALPCLASIGNGAMWARFVDQTVDRSTACLQNDNIFQVALIGLNFCFFDHLGYIGLASPLVGGLCLVPIFWVVICWRGGLSVIQTRVGLDMIMQANICVSITAAAFFALSGYLVFSVAFGSLLIAAQLRRMEMLSFSMSWGSESTEFIIANISAILVGAWYHRLRAVLDVSLRLRDYFKISIKTEPIVPRSVKPYTDLSARRIKELMQASKQGKDLLPTGGHLDWPSVALPDEMPADFEFTSYQILAKTVCTAEHVNAMRAGLQLYDDHFDKTMPDEAIASYVLSKVDPWLEAVKRGNPVFPEQTSRTQRYAAWTYKELDSQNPDTQAGVIAKLTGSIRANHQVCSEQTIQIAEEVYLELKHPKLKVIEPILSFKLQALRRHVLHQFLASLQKKYPTWALDPTERHLVNQFLSVMNQKGMHLGLPEEETASKDRYYSGSLVEALLWFEARRFKKFFLEKYTAEEILTASKDPDREGMFKDEFNKWLAPQETRENLTDSVIRHAARSTSPTGDLEQSHRYGLLVHLGVLAPSKEAAVQLQENEQSW